MPWLKRFHKDHMVLVGVLSKLEGNLKDIEHGELSENIVWELDEFAHLIKNVIMPHFKEEDEVVYPKASSAGEDAEAFISGMYEEHRVLGEAFEGFVRSLARVPDEIKSADQLKRVAQLIKFSRNIGMVEAPKDPDRIVPKNSLDRLINKDEVLKHGNKIVKMLGEHIEKEESRVVELVRLADKL